MLGENIKSTRRSRGLSQEELAIKLHVVRQTVSKWERGISVPDSELLIALGEALDVSVSDLLGEAISDAEETDLQSLSAKLEVVNQKLAQLRASRRKHARLAMLLIAACIAIAFLALVGIGGSYLDWNYSNPEYATAGTIVHGFEWLFVRIAPVAFVAACMGAVAMHPRE